MLTNSKIPYSVTLFFAFTLLLQGCMKPSTDSETNTTMDTPSTVIEPDTQQIKPVVYQVFTRLFGNTNQTNKPWGTIEENGVGKFSDFTPKALQEIRELGVSHIWYTGVPHHAVINDYTAYGISLDDPDVVKGRAGSPYAVKDYYSVNPDLANDPAKRMEEFEALIKRTHDAGMKVIIDIVPNHVARRYQSLGKPQGVLDFGANDDTSVEYARDNNFYYVVGESFKVPQPEGDYQPLGGRVAPLSDGEFEETPAKWTGNGARKAQPAFNDWYETVKINYGVRPDGTYDFPRLPEEYAKLNVTAHHQFWQGKDLPDSWSKFHDIVHFWLDKGVDGFRYDMAEMVPVEFWSYLNSSIKVRNPEAFLLAEVYNPSLYRDYLHLGKMDYLYDKVEFYDTLKLVMQQKQGTKDLADIQARMQDIESHMLHFLENHDEQRIASEPFAGDAKYGKPALVVSSLISRSPMMIYFGQEVGEDGSEETGFGDPTRTTIFDYAGVPAHQRWMNDGKFDGGQLSQEERDLRAYYKLVLNIAATHPAMAGDYQSIHQYNLKRDSGYHEQLFSFTRWAENSALIVVSNFDDDQRAEFELAVPQDLKQHLGLSSGSVTLSELLSENQLVIDADGEEATLRLSLAPLQSAVLSVAR